MKAETQRRIIMIIVFILGLAFIKWSYDSGLMCQWYKIRFMGLIETTC